MCLQLTPMLMERRIARCYSTPSAVSCIIMLMYCEPLTRKGCGYGGIQD